VDASAAVKWVLAEPDSELAQQIVQSSLLAPDLLLIECSNAIWRHVQLGEIDPAEIPRAWAVLRAMPVEIVASDELVERALHLAVVLQHPIYDCLYLALALERGHGSSAPTVASSSPRDGTLISLGPWCCLRSWLAETARDHEEQASELAERLYG
jgi:predicted nucleic acid-binding protein